jgi:signal transduction histidine kinase/DNA-binding response OmpR family regulator
MSPPARIRAQTGLPETLVPPPLGSEPGPSSALASGLTAGSAQTAHSDPPETAAALRAWQERLTLQKQELADRAEQFAQTSQSKSEFLANMSHELRTPLNSLLILSKLLLENIEGNLTAKQLTFARTIHSSGNDLLLLINDILDLSKLEAGMLSVEPCEITLTNLRAHLEQGFIDVAAQKSVEFSMEIRPGVPESIVTDVKRLHQILKNLLSNAFKFTERGHVSLTIMQANYGWAREHERLNAAESVVAFSVTDTGMGIPEAQQRTIFEPFQAGGLSSRQRGGGKGLGLAIARELAKLLGGELGVVSVPGSGSTFTLYLPSHAMAARGQYAPGRSADSRRQNSGAVWSGAPGGAAPISQSSVAPAADGVTLDGAASAAGLSRAAGDHGEAGGEVGAPGSVAMRPERVLLVLDLDPELTRRLVQQAQKRGFTTLTSSDAVTDASAIEKLQPGAIVLDLRPPGLDRWILLDQLAHTPATRHVPIAVLAAPERWQLARRMGAVATLQSAADEHVGRALHDLEFYAPGQTRRLLLMQANSPEYYEAHAAVSGVGVDIVGVAGPSEAVSAMANQRFHSALLTLGTSEPLTSVDAVLAEAGDMPLLVYAPAPLSQERRRELARRSATHNLTVAESLERLLQESCVHLHRDAATLSAAQQELLARGAARAPDLAGMRILLIDDDVRNVFAMTSALERHGAVVAYADTGQAGLELLDAGPPVSAVLVDIVLPDMDGYQVTQQIRQRSGYASLPIIAVTAKAMTADREKCILAGATHYIAKPVDARHLLSALRVAAVY